MTRRKQEKRISVFSPTAFHGLCEKKITEIRV